MLQGDGVEVVAGRRRGGDGRTILKFAVALDFIPLGA